MAKYRCRECHAMENVPRHYRLHYGKRCRCPRCGTFRITKLKERDRIDPMESGFLNLFEKWMGGKLYHCRYCRVQFYDRRKFIPVTGAAAQPKPVAEETPADVTEVKSTATPGG
jgi:hypothetical protein